MIQTRISLLRNKFFFLLGIIIFLSIFFIALTNFQTHENDLIQKIEKLELQNEAMNKQVEVEKEQQHQRLSAERQLYEKTKKELNQKLREQKEINDKENHQSQLRFNSLQQQYKILVTKHDDLDQHCTQVQKDLSTENDELKRKLDHIQAQNSKIQTSKDNDITVWKMKYENEKSEKEKLQGLLNINNGNNANSVGSENADEHQQLIQLKYKNYQLEQEIKDLKKKLHINNENNEEHRQVPAPEINNKAIDKSFQEQIPIIPEPVVDSKNVLQQPALLGKSTTTTPTSILNNNSNKKKESTTTKSSRKLPKFVLPIPDIKNDESEAPKEPVKEDKKQILDETLNKPQNEDINDIENGAHEINDNDFNIEEKNQRNFDNMDPDKNMVNNAAEEFDVHKPAEKKSLGNEEMDLEIINRPANGGNVKDKLKDEIANDHGKEEAYAEEDLHLEQQDEDLGDIGEYDDPNALKNQGIAERN
ncbi:putative leucine-rich repeat-containing protein DDB_G0290503 isoform X2 [Chironomus tepperi]|uniref:putative leucine-rich repeat-containing protein DDB_G0290503 isoform X2 n=1 Tax=Chironomus tepperi TaxID=113505 RepID=UPI00391EEABA